MKLKSGLMDKNMSNSNKFHLRKDSWSFLNYPDKYIEVWEKANSPRKLSPCSTKREFLTASDILTRLMDKKGILLADDVGLGKTTVAALVAWVFAGKGMKVRILAPNKHMKRRWAEEMESHIEPIKSMAKNLIVDKKNLKKTTTQRLNSFNIEITTHKLYSVLNCDLLIIDEVHHAKGKSSDFAKELRKNSKNFDKALILTATPFSINIEELNRMLTLIEASGTEDEVLAFDSELYQLWNKENIDIEESGNKLAEAAQNAVNALKPHVIRHCIKDLEDDEQKEIGKEKREFEISVPQVDSDSLEILLRTDRLLKLCKDMDIWKQNRKNDPRFHVGWAHLREVIDEVEEKKNRKSKKKNSDNLQIIDEYIKKIKKLLKKAENQDHPKTKAVAEEVKRIVDNGEKVLIFCDHHATASEITSVIASKLERKMPFRDRQLWDEAWEDVLPTKCSENSPHNLEKLRKAFIYWLCSPNICAQITNWLEKVPRNANKLANELKNTHAKKNIKCKTIADEAYDLFCKLTDPESKSTIAVLRSISNSKDFKARMPYGGDIPMPAVFAIAEPKDDKWKFLFFQKEPDTAMAIFNSPFGPDVLVTTDRLSEGIDLHGCCRYIIHYELDPSPIRTIQREGRIRRINSWAAKTKEPIEIAYPSFPGTRDEKLVEIMRGRIQRFDLLLGGVGTEITSDNDDNYLNIKREKRRLEIIEVARQKLSNLSLSSK